MTPKGPHPLVAEVNRRLSGHTMSEAALRVPLPDMRTPDLMSLLAAEVEAQENIVARLRAELDEHGTRTPDGHCGDCRCDSCCTLAVIEQMVARERECEGSIVVGKTCVEAFPSKSESWCPACRGDS